jgi:hypothetical protein
VVTEESTAGAILEGYGSPGRSGAGYSSERDYISREGGRQSGDERSGAREVVWRN